MIINKMIIRYLVYTVISIMVSAEVIDISKFNYKISKAFSNSHYAVINFFDKNKRSETMKKTFE
jgi:hypothetical protein